VKPTLHGKQRNAFGSFIVVDKDPTQLEFYGYTATDADNVAWGLLFTTTAQSSVQFLGSHEFYWWPYTKFLLARLSDGSSFKFYRFNSNFRATAPNDGAAAISEQIENHGHRLWHVPNRVMVSPVFYGKLAYFYTADSDSKPHLRVYEYNPLIKAPELKCSEDRNDVDNPGVGPLTVETAQNAYHQFTFVNLGAFGVLYKPQGGTTWTRFLCNPSTGVVTTSNPTFTNPGTLGTLSEASMTIVQVREDPENTADGAAYVVPDLYAIDTGNDGYLMKVVYADGTDTITVDSSVAIPAEYKIQMTPEHVDVGRQHFVVMSPINCAATYDSASSTGSVVTSASVRTYTFATGGWSCNDVPASDTTSSVWPLLNTRRRRELNEYEAYYEELKSRQDPHEL